MRVVCSIRTESDPLLILPLVRLGNSGLRVSKIILGCMSYGDPGWQDWLLGEEEGIKHIKFAYVDRYLVLLSLHPHACSTDTSMESRLLIQQT